MKEVNQRFEVDAPWELAILAYDRKSWSIPNPDFKEILRCDFDEWAVDPGNQVTNYRRRAQLAVPAPAWLMNMLSGDKDMWYEFRSTINRQSRVLTVKGINITLTNFLKSEEYMRMAADPVDQNRCVLTFHTTYEINAPSFLKSRAEALVAKLYARALKRGRAIDKKYIDKYKKTHGTRDLPLTRSELYGLELHEMRQAEANRQARQMIRNPSSVGTIFGGDGKPGVLHVLTVDDLCSPVGEQVSDV